MPGGGREGQNGAGRDREAEPLLPPEEATHRGEDGNLREEPPGTRKKGMAENVNGRAEREEKRHAREGRPETKVGFGRVGVEPPRDRAVKTRQEKPEPQRRESQHPWKESGSARRKARKEPVENGFERHGEPGMVEEGKEVGGLPGERAHRNLHVEVAADREQRTVENDERNRRQGARHEKKRKPAAARGPKEGARDEHEARGDGPHEQAVETSHSHGEPRHAEEERVAPAAASQDIEAVGDRERHEPRPDDGEDGDAVQPARGPGVEKRSEESGPAWSGEAEEERARRPEREHAGEHIGHVVPGGGRAGGARPRVTDDGFGEIALRESPRVGIGREDAVVAVPRLAALEPAPGPPEDRCRDRRVA